jgi:hypothetical protein
MQIKTHHRIFYYLHMKKQPVNYKHKDAQILNNFVLGGLGFWCLTPL